MVTVEDYLQLGYRGIVILDSQWHEKGGGYQDEHTRQTIACYDKNGIPRKIIINWTHRFRPRSGVSKSHLIEAVETLDQDMYTRIITESKVLDDSLYFQEKAKKESRQRIAEIALEKITPNCPVCGNKMIVRKNNNDNKYFWGCVGYRQNKCRGTRLIVSKALEQYHEYQAILNQR